MHRFWLYNHDLNEADFIIIIPYRYLFAFRFSIAYANNFSILTQLKSMYIAFFFPSSSCSQSFSLFRFPFQDRFLYFNDLINIRGERTINATRIAIIKMKAVFRWLFFYSERFFPCLLRRACFFNKD